MGIRDFKLLAEHYVSFFYVRIWGKLEVFPTDSL